MFVDASALTAMMTDEVDARELLARLQRTRMRVTSPLAVWETSLAVARILAIPAPEAAAAVDQFLKLVEIGVMDVPARAAGVAVEAFDRFGKGRHPANLNFGDCFAYACAKLSGQPLMFKGADFSQTDIDAG